MSENKTGKYFKYAIGEIVLVVIGILIALQINNWNESRKTLKLTDSYLKNIKSDLQKDIVQVDRIINEHIKAIGVIHSIDSTILTQDYHAREKFKHLFTELDTTNFKYIFYRGYSFRPINGAFNSLLSDGKSGLIKNRVLFQKIQEIYSELNQRLESNYDNLKRVEEKVQWEYAVEKQNWTYSDLKRSKNEKVFFNLANFTEQRYFYAMNLSDLKNKMLEALEILENEIQQ